MLEGNSCIYCGNTKGVEEKPKQPKWRKILYEPQPYPDNYVDSTFLIGLVQNANFIQYDFWTVVQESAAVSQQVTIVALFCIVFVGTLQGGLGLPFLLAMDALLVVMGYLFRIAIDTSTIGVANSTRFFAHCFRMILLFGAVFALSPVLHTLTNAFSNDTIWALTSLLLILHLYFHDYGFINGVSDKFTAPVSLNAAIFASVLLASRLPSNLHVFVLISYAIELFALFPIMRHHLKKFSVELHLGLTLLMFILTVGLLLGVSTFISTVYVVAIVSITFLGPSWLIFIQKYKNEINGPWDEAIVTNLDGLSQN